jgi:protein-S-isoprenylcysteine O-methyltransferase Ste14
MAKVPESQNPSAQPLELRRSMLSAITVAIAFLLVAGSISTYQHFLHEAIEWAGIGLMVFCIVGRTWCSLYLVGGRNPALVKRGPYSVCRNPLYLFSIVGAVGAGAQSGSIVVALAAGFVAWSILLRFIMKEEWTLLAYFGDDYIRYFARVARFLPRPSLWHDSAALEIKPRLVMRTFVGSLLFLVSIPIAEAIEYLQDIGVLTIYIPLP